MKIAQTLLSGLMLASGGSYAPLFLTPGTELMCQSSLKSVAEVEDLPTPLRTFLTLAFLLQGLCTSCLSVTSFPRSCFEKNLLTL